ncbi:AI-2E family transporter [Patescibacteria group bacterium]|nr:AI-2E family transporter [Patescibacteria group bacterium]
MYIERTILIPFILGGIFAYVFNPFINFVSHKTRLPRIVSIIIFYIVIFSVIGVLGNMISRRVLEESSDLKLLSRNLLLSAKHGLSTSPQWLRASVNDALVALHKSNLFSTSSIFYLFPQAIHKIVGFIVFIFSSFYFLKDGRNMLDRILNLIPNNYRIEVELLLKKINTALSAYLRGEIFLISFVSLVLFIALSIVGVRLALLLAIFSGFAEIVPIIGPIVAGLAAVLVVIVTGTVNFSLTPFVAVLVVVGIYFVMRQFQDYVVSPYIMGRITNLHPLLILFAVLAGEHLWGILGLVLAVPIAAVIRILLGFSLDKINEQDLNVKYGLDSQNPGRE